MTILQKLQKNSIWHGLQNPNVINASERLHEKETDGNHKLSNGVR